jgi:hypothetical protein
MADSNAYKGLPSCKVDEQGGVEQCFRLNRCFVARTNGQSLAVCQSCHRLENEYFESRKQALLQFLRRKGFHVSLSTDDSKGYYRDKDTTMIQTLQIVQNPAGNYDVELIERINGRAYGRRVTRTVVATRNSEDAAIAALNAYAQINHVSTGF